MEKAIAFLKKKHNLSASEAKGIVKAVVSKFGKKKVKSNCKSIISIMLKLS